MALGKTQKHDSIRNSHLLILKTSSESREFNFKKKQKNSETQLKNKDDDSINSNLTSVPEFHFPHDFSFSQENYYQSSKSKP